MGRWPLIKTLVQICNQLVSHSVKQLRAERSIGATAGYDIRKRNGTSLVLFVFFFFLRRSRETENRYRAHSEAPSAIGIVAARQTTPTDERNPNNKHSAEMVVDTIHHLITNEQLHCSGDAV